jgi:hypothetical protein
MLPIVFILVFIGIFAFISFAINKKKSGEDLGEHK